MGIVMVVLMVGSVFLFWGRGKTTTNGAAVSEARGDVFRGMISNMAVQPGTLQGMGVYDRSCKMLGNGLTACDAGIQTEEYGLLNFKYQHNMQQQPCLAPNDLVAVRILDAQGNAEIERRY